MDHNSVPPRAQSSAHVRRHISLDNRFRAIDACRARRCCAAVGDREEESSSSPQGAAAPITNDRHTADARLPRRTPHQQRDIQTHISKPCIKHTCTQTHVDTYTPWRQRWLCWRFPRFTPTSLLITVWSVTTEPAPAGQSHCRQQVLARQSRRPHQVKFTPDARFRRVTPQLLLVRHSVGPKPRLSHSSEPHSHGHGPATGAVRF